MKVNNIFLIAAAVTVVVPALVVSGAAAAKNNKLSAGQEITPARCDEAGKLVVNVKENIVNTVDSGEAGNNWAFDTMNRQIQVRDNGDGTFCVVMRNEGKFDAQAGQTSPGAGGVLTGDEDGTYRGGYRATITGTLKTTPVWRTNGSVGTTDYQCDISGTCPGYVNWAGQYFEPGYGFTYDWWGWIYTAGGYGSWLNSSDGNSGDIL